MSDVRVYDTGNQCGHASLSEVFSSADAIMTSSLALHMHSQRHSHRCKQHPPVTLQITKFSELPRPQLQAHFCLPPRCRANEYSGVDALVNGHLPTVIHEVNVTVLAVVDGEALSCNGPGVAHATGRTRLNKSSSSNIGNSLGGGLTYR